MLCQLRTIGAGVGALAICLMLSSLSWQFVLAGFAVASIGWAFWSWSVQLSPPKVAPRKNAIAFQPRRRVNRQNLYSFPAQDWNNQGSGY